MAERRDVDTSSSTISANTLGCKVRRRRARARFPTNRSKTSKCAPWGPELIGKAELQPVPDHYEGAISQKARGDNRPPWKAVLEAEGGSRCPASSANRFLMLTN